MALPLDMALLMEWLWIILALATLALVIVLRIVTPKGPRHHSLSGFDFSQFKDRELSKRGVYDRTKWW